MHRVGVRQARFPWQENHLFFLSEVQHHDGSGKRHSGTFENTQLMGHSAHLTSCNTVFSYTSQTVTVMPKKEVLLSSILFLLPIPTPLSKPFPFYDFSALRLHSPPGSAPESALHFKQVPASLGVLNLPHSLPLKPSKRGCRVRKLSPSCFSETFLLKNKDDFRSNELESWPTEMIDAAIWNDLPGQNQ